MTGEIYKIVSDEEIEAVWGNANFGPRADKRAIIADTLLKWAGDFSSGHTATTICQELGLLGAYKPSRSCSLTKKGRRYLFYFFSSYGEEYIPRERVAKLARSGGFEGFAAFIEKRCDLINQRDGGRV